MLVAELLLAVPASDAASPVVVAQVEPEGTGGDGAPIDRPSDAPAQPFVASTQSAPLPPAIAPVVAIVPKIIEVNPRRFAPRTDGVPDRQLLLREFPDDLVEALWLQDWQSLEAAYQFGRLVDVASDPEGRGILLRLEGGSRIGELEERGYFQTLLCRLAKPAAGLLYQIAARLRQMEGAAYEPLEVTSLVRTWDYQLRLTDVNPNADRTRDGVPPTHVLGLAFDIARSQMSAERQGRLELLFDQMAADGELAYYKEGSSNGLRHYHVIALPSAEFALVAHYDRATGGTGRVMVVEGERVKRNPDSPCVTFGVSLEPFSSICSCELPADLVAATSLVGIPDSN